MASWTESYNCHSLRIARGTLTITVDWKRGGYEVSCAGRRLKAQFDDLREAKSAGIGLARKILAEAAADLDADEHV